jgi:hypothetical protein
MAENDATISTSAEALRPASMDVANLDVVATPVAAASVAGLQHVLVVIHGIRDNGAWATDHQQSLMHDGVNIKIVPLSHHWMTAPRFIWQRKTDLLAAAWQVTVGLRKIFESVPQGVPVSLLCHSNGTKVAAEVLKEIGDFRFNYIFLAGAVCSRDAGHVFEAAADVVINFIGVRDHWPLVAAAANPVLNGATGVFGFGSVKIQDLKFDFKHDGALEMDHFRAQILPRLALENVRSKMPPERYFPEWLGNPTKTRVGFYMLGRLATWPIRALAGYAKWCWQSIIGAF